MVVPFMTIYCTQQLNFSITQTGLIMSLFGLGAIAGIFTGGKITDKFGFYYLQVGALLTGGLFYILLGYQKSFISLSICTFVLSFCNESFRPANASAILSYSTAENRTRSYSLNRFAINMGWSVGGALGGYLASIDYRLLFWVDGCTNIFAALLLLKLLPVAKPTHKNKQASQLPKPVSAYRDILYICFIISVVLYAVPFFQIFTMQPVFFKTQWHFNERFIGFLMALNGIVIILFEMVIIHYLEKKRTPLHYIIAGVLLTCLGFIFSNLLQPNTLSAIVIVVFIAFGEILALPFMNSFWIARTNAFNQGEYAALYSMAWSTAQILAPAIGSIIILNHGYELLWWILSASCLIAAFGFALLLNSSIQNHKKGMDLF